MGERPHDAIIRVAAVTDGPGRRITAVEVCCLERRGRLSDMTVDENPTDTRLHDNDLTAADVAWDIDTILPDGTTPADLFDRADALADELAGLRGRIGTLEAGELADVMHRLAELQDLMSRAGYHAMLAFSTATDDPARGAAMAAAQERSTAIGTKLIFIDLEWAAADDDHVTDVLADPRLDFCRHHLDNLRLSRPYLLSEAEETIVAEKSQTGFSAWTRLFDELTSAITVDLPDEFGGPGRPLMQAASILQHPDRAVRKQVADGITAGLEPGLRTRAFLFNTLLLDKSIDDRLPRLPVVDLVTQSRQRGLRRIGAGPGRRRRRQLLDRPALVHAQGTSARPRPARRLRPHGVGGHRRS